MLLKLEYKLPPDLVKMQNLTQVRGGAGMLHSYRVSGDAVAGVWTTLRVARI